VKRTRPNHYEIAFGNWLRDNRVRYIAVDEKKRAAFGLSGIKSFDYLLTINSRQIIAEVKGRKFKGTSFAKMSGFECWVTADDIEGLSNWHEVFGYDHIPAFVFAYHIEKIDVDYDGRGVYEFQGRRYIFFCVRLDDYCRYMKLRSPKWRTVTLSANDFRKCAVQMQDILL
jgi:hypothetical protein